MPIFDVQCPDCGHEGEIIHMGNVPLPPCPACGQGNLEKRLSATSAVTGRAAQGLPGPGDTGCCGSTPGHAGCAGPGTCCGKTGH